jgi:hypothetical protein
MKEASRGVEAGAAVGSAVVKNDLRVAMLRHGWGGTAEQAAEKRAEAPSEALNAVSVHRQLAGSCRLLESLCRFSAACSAVPFRRAHYTSLPVLPRSNARS